MVRSNQETILDLTYPKRASTGTLYPLLVRFEVAGWLKSEWEDVDPKEVGRPRKRFYWLTPTGRARANAALASISSRSGEAVSWA
jgi:DNA-binding PadR family transcriptional regulator